MTRFSNVLNRLKHPIIQAPMAGGVVSSAMIAAVTKAGGLGSLPLGYLDAKATEDAVKKTVAATSGPFSVNVFIPSPPKFISAEQMSQMLEHVNQYRQKLGLNDLTEAPFLQETSPETLIDIAVHHGVRIISFTFGTLSEETINRLHQADVVVIGTATTVNEGKLLQTLGCDAVIAQGFEAGGHRGGGYIENESGGEIGTMTLIPQMVDALNIPVIATGGIMDGRGIVAALTLGASAVQMGTAFLACKESLASELHKKTLLESPDNSTCITSAFTGKPVRGIKNAYIIETEKRFCDNELLAYPIQHQITKDFRAKANQSQMTQWASFWAGQGHRMSRPLTVAELMGKLSQEIQEETPNHRFTK
ncbi:MAG TPA: nitronate monooxygenase [Bacteroidetes bacterium]|nr:nitronate monooxygenase [Bacteroidota bacterium]